MGVETVRFAITLLLLETGSLLCRLLWSSKEENENQERECREGIKGLWGFCELGKLWQKKTQSQMLRVILVRLVLWFLKWNVHFLSCKLHAYKRVDTCLSMWQELWKTLPLRMLSKIINIKTKLFLYLSICCFFNTEISFPSAFEIHLTL